MARTSSFEPYLVDHLLRRAGFGCSLEEQRYFRKQGFDASLDELLNPEEVKNDKLEELLETTSFDFTDLGDLKRWWLYRMMFTRRPLEEKLCLFWHGHFATSNAGKVNNPYLMYQQNQRLRELGMGRFENLLLAVSKDPAMIIWLDNKDNRKGKPNENYAREIMELFTLGIGNYSENDIKEAARAFTGWTAPNGFYFNKKQHDFGEKSFLSEKGKFDGTDIVRILAARKETASFLARKLIKFFCMDKPEDAFVERVQNAYLKNSEQNIKAMLKEIFSSNEFKSEKSYHAKVKSPAEFVVGTMKALQVTKLDADLPSVMARMGQNLFEPPSVKGWDGGMSWIATDTLMERFNFAHRISMQKFDTKEGYINPEVLASQFSAASMSDMVDYFLSRLVDKDLPHGARRKLVEYALMGKDGAKLSGVPDPKTLDMKIRGLIHLIMTLPSYQLA